MVESESPSIVIIDSSLPDACGIEVLEQIRQSSEVPILFLSPLKGNEVDIVEALEHGADDCLIKPFGQMEFLARVEKLIRRR